MFFCGDALQEKYVGSSVVPIGDTSVADVKLSDVARRELTRYTANHPAVFNTQLGSVPTGIRCNFGKRCPDSVLPAEIREIIDINHPLVRWLLDENERSAIYASGCEVVSVLQPDLPKECSVRPGFYAYGVRRWKTSGVRNINELRYYFAPGQYDEFEAPRVESGDAAERLLVTAMMRGRNFDANLLSPEDYNACGMALGSISEKMDEDFCDFAEDQKRRNADLVEEQSKYVERTASIKAGKLQASINKMLAEGKGKGAKLNQDKLEKMLSMRDARVARIKDKLDCSPEDQVVAVGILVVRGVEDGI